MITHKQIHQEAESFVRFWKGRRLPLEEVVLGTLYGLHVPAHEWEHMKKRVRHYLTESHRRKGKWHVRLGKKGHVRFRHHKGKKGKRA